MAHVGYIDLSDLSVEKFLLGEECYIASVTTTGGILIHLQFIELDHVGSSLAIADIPNETAFLDVSALTDFLADLTQC